MNNFQTSYYKFDSSNEEDDPTNEEAHLVHVSEHNKALWHHIEDLDNFFVRVYQYYQNHGFKYILAKHFLEFIEFLFVVTFLTFLSSCVNYDVLFANNLPPNATYEKVGFEDVIYSTHVCSSRIEKNPLLIIFLVVASTICAFKAGKTFYAYYQLKEMKKFYCTALHIKEEELDELTWQEVQKRLMRVQTEQQMCIHKQHLTELDIYNRILRVKNYMVAMVNKALLPPRFTVPILGEVVFFTEGLKYTVEFLLFYSPWSPFANRYHLKDEYKMKSRREELAALHSRYCLYLGIISLILSPIIFLWQVVYTFFSYTDLLKREPGAFSARTWSLYARLYFRHFNELPHEFQDRLNRGYKPAKLYMESFNSALLALFAKTVAFIFGSFLAVLVLLTLWDFDVLEVEHLLAIGAFLTFVVHICRTLIPDENAVSCPEQLMRQVIAKVHYAPDSWHGQAHTYSVRNQFAQLFQYKAVYILEELLSPLITPFVLIFWMRKRSMLFVDFYRNFTVDIDGVGDVCSFAQLDIKKHGDPKWHEDSKDDKAYYQKADDGKLELSLMHFSVANPQWDIPRTEVKFLENVKNNAQKSAPVLKDGWIEHNQLTSSSMGIDPLAMPMLIKSGIVESPTSIQPHLRMHCKQNTPAIEGATYNQGVTVHSQTASNHNMNRSLLLQSELTQSSLMPDQHYTTALPTRFDTLGRRRDLMSMEMSISALYMHELHQQRLQNHHNTMMWETIPDHIESETNTVNNHGSSIVADMPETTKLYPNSTGPQQGYETMSPLTTRDLFGNLPEQTLNQPVLLPSSNMAMRPFLDVLTGEEFPRENGNDGENSSDSDMAPQEFHIDDHVRQEPGLATPREIQNSNNSYQPPKV